MIENQPPPHHRKYSESKPKSGLAGERRTAQTPEYPAVAKIAQITMKSFLKAAGSAASLNNFGHRAICQVIALTALLAPGMGSAQAIDTNRPGFSFSPNVVAVGQWQLETGVSWDRVDSDTSIVSLPLAEFRYGVSDGFELFVSSLGWSNADYPGGSASGLVDMAIGTKLALGDTSGITRMAVLFQVSVPAGSNDFSSDRWDPGVGFIWSHAGRLPLAGTVKVSRFGDGYRLDNGLKLPFATSGGNSAFVEWEANLPERGDDAHWLNGGYQWLIDDVAQFDLNGGLGLNSTAGDYRVGLGYSIRF